MPAPTTGTVSDIGFDGKVYYNSGTRAAEVLVPIPRVTEVALDIDGDEIETSIFGVLWKMYAAGMLDVNIEISYGKKRSTLADTVFDTLRDARLNRDALEIFILDGDATVEGVQGLRAFCMITGMSAGRTMGDRVVTKFKCRPTDYEEAAALVLPEWYTVEGA